MTPFPEIVPQEQINADETWNQIRVAVSLAFTLKGLVAFPVIWMMFRGAV